MAKWGEGDPRWIVEERADATNVNNWHWTEKNATNWSKNKFTELFQGFVIEDDTYTCEVTEITKAEGEAVANNRKGKLIFFYEWILKADWKGGLKDGDTKYNGKLEVLNLSEENEPHEIDIEVTVANEKKDGFKVKEFMRTKGVEELRNQIRKYINSLREEFGQGMILPAKEEKPKVPTSKSKNDVKAVLNKPVTSTKNNVAGVKIPCKKITDKVEFKCEAKELFRALTEPEMVRAFTRGNAQVEPEKGGRFALFDGNVTGEFTQLKPEQKLEMKWRFKTWPAEHYSEVIMDLEQKDACTELVLTQTGVPENEVERTKTGWQQYYWESIKQTFGFGARLF